MTLEQLVLQHVDRERPEPAGKADLLIRRQILVPNDNDAMCKMCGLDCLELRVIAEIGEVRAQYFREESVLS